MAQTRITSTSGGGGGGAVDQLIAGPGICLSPSSGQGTVTICADQSFAVVQEGAGSGSSYRISNNNNASGTGSTVLGTCNNGSASLSTVSGGYRNSAEGIGAFVGGGQNNKAYGCNSSVISGAANRACADNSSVLSGCGNIVYTANSMVLAGWYNSISSGTQSVITGGNQNTIGTVGDSCGSYSAIVSGYQNTVSNNYSFIIGGVQNSVSGNYSSVAGGRQNVITNSFNSHITSGATHCIINGGDNAIFSGIENRISCSAYSATASGYINYICDTTYGFIGTGLQNQICQGDQVAIVSGRRNLITNISSGSAVLAGNANIITASSYVTASGYGNCAENGQFVNFSNGAFNYTCRSVNVFFGNTNGSTIVSGQCSAIVSGETNCLDCVVASAILSGQTNLIQCSYFSSMSGGYGHVISCSDFATIVGGSSNQLLNGACYSVIHNGRSNSVSACYSSASGEYNCVMSNYSIVTGRQSKAFRYGSKTHSNGDFDARQGFNQHNQLFVYKRTDSNVIECLALDGLLQYICLQPGSIVSGIATTQGRSCSGNIISVVDTFAVRFDGNTATLLNTCRLASAISGTGMSVVVGTNNAGYLDLRVCTTDTGADWNSHIELTELVYAR